MKEVVDRIIKELDAVTANFKGDKAKFSKPGYKTFEISKDNFHSFDVLNDDVKIGFIDGGNSEIIGTANFSLQLVRIYGCVFSGNKKILEERNEFFVLIKSKGGEDIRYCCELFPIKGEVLVEERNLEFSSMDPTIKEGVFRASIGKIGDIVRRFSELRLAEKIVDGLEKGDFIVLDGTLESNYSNETEYLEKLYEKGVVKNVLITALAKSTRIFTENGDNLTGLLNSIGEGCVWYYYPIANINSKEHKAELYFVKLNKRAGYVFRFEVFKEQKCDIDKILGGLAANSSDLIFPGYPYGLITADKFARVSNKEKEYYKVLFMAKIGRKGKKLEKYLSSSSAHSVLDTQ